MRRLFPALIIAGLAYSIFRTLKAASNASKPQQR